MLRFEPTVRIVYFSEPLSKALHLASVWALVSKIGLVVNSIDDLQHGPTTLHGFSLAVDLDTEGDKPEDLRPLYGYLARHLPEGFEVLLERDHVHVEWDMHRAPVPAPLGPAKPA
jgi:hypothetical protein